MNIKRMNWTGTDRYRRLAPQRQWSCLSERLEQLPFSKKDANSYVPRYLEYIVMYWASPETLYSN